MSYKSCMYTLGLLIDWGRRVEATVPPFWHYPNIVKHRLEAIEMHLLM